MKVGSITGVFLERNQEIGGILYTVLLIRINYIIENYSRIGRRKRTAFHTENWFVDG